MSPWSTYTSDSASSSSSSYPYTTSSAGYPAQSYPASASHYPTEAEAYAARYQSSSAAYPTSHSTYGVPASHPTYPAHHAPNPRASTYIPPSHPFANHIARPTTMYCTCSHHTRCPACIALEREVRPLPLAPAAAPAPGLPSKAAKLLGIPATSTMPLPFIDGAGLPEPVVEKKRGFFGKRK